MLIETWNELSDKEKFLRGRKGSRILPPSLPITWQERREMGGAEAEEARSDKYSGESELTIRAYQTGSDSTALSKSHFLTSCSNYFMRETGRLEL